MSETLELVIELDSESGELTYEHPEGCSAIELGRTAAISLLRGKSLYNAQFDRLVLKQPGTGTEHVLDLTQEAVQPISAGFPNNAHMLMYNNLRSSVAILNQAENPVVGENDLVFEVQLSEGSTIYSLDPEIRVRSGTGHGTATWAPDNTAMS